MHKSTILSVWLLTATALFTAGTTLAQDSAELPEPYREPIPFYLEVLGPYTFDISSENEETQRFFNQGMQLMYSFAKVDAVRSFREAWKRDPNLSLIHI